MTAFLVHFLPEKQHLSDRALLFCFSRVQGSTWGHCLNFPFLFLRPAKARCGRGARGPWVSHHHLAHLGQNRVNLEGQASGFRGC